MYPNNGMSCSGGCNGAAAAPDLSTEPSQSIAPGGATAASSLLAEPTDSLAYGGKNTFYIPTYAARNIS
jgi:hypothetical protein